MDNKQHKSSWCSIFYTITPIIWWQTVEEGEKTTQSNSHMVSSPQSLAKVLNAYPSQPFKCIAFAQLAVLVTLTQTSLSDVTR